MAITITVTGNLSRDAEVKQTRNGKTLTTFSIGHTPREKRDGEWTNGETMWFKVTYWGELPGVFLSTGSKVMVTGSFKQESYDKDGTTRWSNIITAESVGSLLLPVRNDASVYTPTSSVVPDTWLETDDTPF